MHCCIIVEVLPKHNLLQVEHNDDAHHTMAIKNVSQTALAAYGLEQDMVFLNVERFIESFGGEPHHRADEA